MLKWITNISLLVLVSYLTACSQARTTTSAPTTTDPLNTGVQRYVPGTPGAGAAPDMTGSVPVNLADPVHYSGLVDLFHEVAPDEQNRLVGNPLFLLNLVRTGNSVTGYTRLGFEDTLGAIIAELKTFDAVSTMTSTNLDVTLADDEFVLRITAGIQGTALTNRTIYYRVRRANENQCKKIVVNCLPYGNAPANGCDTTPPDTATPCQAYMNPSNPDVKLLGTFSAVNYPTWVR